MSCNLGHARIQWKGKITNETWFILGNCEFEIITQPLLELSKYEAAEVILKLGLLPLSTSSRVLTHTCCKKREFRFWRSLSWTDWHWDSIDFDHWDPDMTGLNPQVNVQGLEDVTNLTDKTLVQLLYICSLYFCISERTVHQRDYLHVSFWGCTENICAPHEWMSN